MRSDLDDANARIAELEAALDGEDEEDTANAEANAMATAAFASGAWIVGTTALGTAGVAPDHVDDLKKIKGIGPKLEGVLQEKGVQTYEQLAALTAEEQGIVNDSLDSFPGRIYRDEWVPQAQAIMANGHAPLTNAKKADLESANARIDELESELSDASSAHDRLGLVEGELRKAKGLQSDLDARNARIGELEGELANAQALQAEIDARNARVGELEAELVVALAMQSEIEARNARVAELEADLAIALALQTEIDARNARVEALETELEIALAMQAEIDARNARISELEGELANAQALQAEIDARNARVGELEAELVVALAMQSEIEARNARVAELEADLAIALALQTEIDARNARVEALETELEIALAMQAEIDARNARISELEGELSKAAETGAEMGQLRVAIAERNRRIEALETAARSAASADDLAKAKATIDKRNARIAELEAAEAAMPADARHTAAWVSGAWKSGTTKLGTPGLDHNDDLKVVSGIGPQMEKLLNSFGIKSWEQLADLDKDQVATVDGALTDFPGRITRDEWVPQAKAIMDNGHKPVTSAPKPRKKAKSKKKATASWQKGTTKLGTAGAGHKDDLKVINGIGPKMEGILNGFGIQAWEQLAALKKDEVEKVNNALEAFPGRITRDDWMGQAKQLVKQFPDTGKRPTRKTYLNNSGDTDPFN